MPIKKTKNVGAKNPEVGTPPLVAGIDVLPEYVAVGVGVIIFPEGVAVKAGRLLAPAAKTVKVRLTTVPSAKEAVMVCSPGGRSEGGVQSQVPSELTVT